MKDYSELLLEETEIRAKLRKIEAIKARNQMVDKIENADFCSIKFMTIPAEISTRTCNDFNELELSIDDQDTLSCIKNIIHGYINKTLMNGDK